MEMFTTVMANGVACIHVQQDFKKSHSRGEEGGAFSQVQSFLSDTTIDSACPVGRMLIIVTGMVRTVMLKAATQQW